MKTFNKRDYIQRQKAMLRNLTHRPDVENSLLGKVIICYRDKEEWIIICNSNGWNC